MNLQAEPDKVQQEHRHLLESIDGTSSGCKLCKEHLSHVFMVFGNTCA